ncbi:VOC family protein [Labedaea rhizosphaerae]|uniref:VOC domain-containing protein n=1 Tax=Labedaea rhizosphaerae TaxID=598644 RepID=A0A4R6SBM2_LABRH|nr:VOC family protein [Labedaea rhizosphaerae]TDP97362.1 hypothetical protein EV186_103326 [Labedaea rhizosphaerae]
MTTELDPHEDTETIIPGTPIWVDLATPDPVASKEFYAELFGWTYEVDPVSGYIIASADALPCGGIFGFTDRYLPPGWTVHLATGNAANTVDRVRASGGGVALEPVFIAGQGSLAVAIDPTGAAVGFLEPVPEWRFGTMFPNTFNWAELNTHDGETADKFYQHLFGFELEQIGDGVDYDYTTWALRGDQVLGRLKMGPEFAPDHPSHWMVYFGVDPEMGTDLVANRAIRLGARVTVEPFDSPFGRLAVIEDVTGAVSTLIDPSRTTTVVPEEVIGAEVDDPYDD